MTGHHVGSNFSTPDPGNTCAQKFKGGMVLATTPTLTVSTTEDRTSPMLTPSTGMRGKDITTR